MRAEHHYFIAFVVTAIVYIAASIMELTTVYYISNILLVPFLLFFYFSKAKKVKWLLVLALVLFYLRDILIGIGFMDFPLLIFGCFFLAMTILIFFAISEYQKTRMRFVEFLSFAIVYAFCLYLFFNLAEMVPNHVPAYNILFYIYLLFLVVFLSISFTVYYLKAHKASLWIMICASSVTFSEASLFFKTFVLRDLSVVLFHSLFHAIALLSLVMYALNRRKKNKLLFF